jgi:hypothetical protein
VRLRQVRPASRFILDRRRYGFQDIARATDQGKASIGKGRRFVGVYSGRLGAEDEFKAQLGIVWKESALISLVESVPQNEKES